jgi:hypothetical protein
VTPRPRCRRAVFDEYQQPATCAAYICHHLRRSPSPPAPGGTASPNPQRSVSSASPHSPSSHQCAPTSNSVAGCAAGTRSTASASA